MLSFISNFLTAPEDFSSVNEVFTIVVGHTTDLCVTIQLEEDNIFEDAEVFDVLLITDTVTLCSIRTTSSVSISDSTCKCIVFEQS